MIEYNPDSGLKCHSPNSDISKVSSLLGAMDKRGEVVEELEAVVKLYRERILEEEKAVEDSVEEIEGVFKLHRERIKLLEEETEESSETNVDLYTKSEPLKENETVEELKNVANLSEESKTEKCDKKEWNVAEEDSEIERLKRRIAYDTSNS